jgi:hypothetical protein
MDPNSKGDGQSLELKDLNCKFGANGTTREKVAKDANEDWVPLPKQVDNLEWTLADAMLAYRSRVEEALLNHLEAMDHAESAHNLEVATLRAENAMLRGKLGISSIRDEMFQNVVMCAEKPKPLSVRDKKMMIRDSAAGSEDSPRAAPAKVNTAVTVKASDSNGTATTPGTPWSVTNRANKDKKGKVPSVGGTWQQFIAWVPIGAALQNAEPWKPLPGDTSMQPLQSSAATAMVPTTPGSASTPLGGRRKEEKDFVQVDSEKAEDGDSEDSNASVKEEYIVLSVWQSTAKEIKERTASCSSMSSIIGKMGAKVVPTGSESESDRQADDASDQGSEGGDSFEHDGYQLPVLIIHPHSKKRITWDILSLIMVTNDIIMVPMGSFNLPDSTFLDTVEWLTRLFWTTDMIWSMRTGVILKDGSLNTDWRFILRRYLRTWFIVDSFVVGIDWIEMLISSMSDAGGFIAMSRAFRAARGARLVRLFKMQEVFKTMMERVQSNWLVVAFCVGRILMFVTFFAHLTACAWWLVGDSSDDASWKSNGDYENKSLDAQYLVCLHWSLSQFTGGMDEVAPQTAMERFFAVIIWLITFMATAIILSYLTSKLTQLNMISGTQSRQVATLRKYLAQNHISSNLALRMQRSAQHALSGDLTQDAVELLPVVSEPLRVEMHFEMYSTVMRTHSFFGEYMKEQSHVMRRVCHYAIGTVLLSNQDVLFSKGEVPSNPKMYIVAKGTLEYHFPGGPDTVVSETHCIAEAALWTKWTYLGTLTSTTDTKLAALDAKMFQEIVDRFKAVGACDPKAYAADFVAYLNILANTAGVVSDLVQLRV